MNFNNNLAYISLTIIALLTVLWSCERDDICAESTPTTPHLIIRFNDINNPDNSKQVRQLSVFGEGQETPLVFQTDTDSFVLPLWFQAENVITTTRFELIKDADYDDDEDDTTLSNTDILEVIYTPQFIYVSRACGYKSIFTGLETDFDNPDGDPWIFSQEIVNSTIETEDNAHLILFH